MTVTWWVGDTIHPALLHPVGVYNPVTGLWNYAGGDIDAATGVALSFNLNGAPDPLVSGNLAVSNPALPAVTVVIEVILPIDPSLGAPTVLRGSAAVGLTTDAGGGSLMPVPDAPLWEAIIDGRPVPGTELFPLPFQGLILGGLGSVFTDASFGDPTPIPGPAALESIGFRISFSLTQFDQASFTSTFEVVPAPGPFAALVIGAMYPCRRRRRQPRLAVKKSRGTGPPAVRMAAVTHAVLSEQL